MAVSRSVLCPLRLVLRLSSNCQTLGTSNEELLNAVCPLFVVHSSRVDVLFRVSPFPNRSSSEPERFLVVLIPAFSTGLFPPCVRARVEFLLSCLVFCLLILCRIFFLFCSFSIFSSSFFGNKKRNQPHRQNKKYNSTLTSRRTFGNGTAKAAPICKKN